MIVELKKKDFFIKFLINECSAYLNSYKFENFYDFSNYENHYSNSFLKEYETHPKIQLDSFNELNINENRLYVNSKWKKQDLKNKNVLEVGSGAGKFTEILIKTECNLFTIDSSDAIKINYKNNYNKLINDKTYFIKTDADKFIFQHKVFDYILIYGVLQNVKNQKKIIKNSIQLLKPGGKLSFDVTKGRKFYLHLINPKYLWRIFSIKINPAVLYNIVKFIVTKFYPVDTFFKAKLGKIGRIIAKILCPFPLINYHYLKLDLKSKIEMSVLDTYDALASRYDKPLTLNQIKKKLSEIEVENNISINNLEILEKNNLFVVNFSI